MAVVNTAKNKDLLGGARSVTGKRWTLRAVDKDAVVSLARAVTLDPNVARLLVGRGVETDDAQEFLNPKLRTAMPDPSSLVDMDAAATAILDAMDAGKSITVFADYDVDGGTSAAQLIRWARALGHEFGLYVPDRILEGYGPSREAFETLKSKGQDLVITVDCGAAAKLALEAAQDIGLDVVVVDHHLMGAKIPPTLALVNPNRPDDESGLGYLAAAGVTFLLLVALNREAKARGRDAVPNLMDFLGLAALGTVCDVVPLLGLNRAIVSQGLHVLSARKQAGVAALADVARAQRDLGVYDLGFLLGPRINAGGRIGRASLGAELLATDDATVARANSIELDRINTERRTIQDQMQREALEQALRLDSPDSSCLVLADPRWHPGIIGVVAGRLKERFGKPTILIGSTPDGLGKGSGRSIKGVNLGKAIAAAKEAGLLVSGGGHAMAGGLSMDLGKLAELRSFIETALAEPFKHAKQRATTKVDLLLEPGAVDLSLIDSLERVGPFGSENPKPTVVLPDVRISYADRLRGGHVRCTFEAMDGRKIQGIAFRANESGLESTLFTPTSRTVHVLGTLKRDRFRGNERVDFHVKDIAEGGFPLGY